VEDFMKRKAGVLLLLAGIALVFIPRMQAFPLRVTLAPWPGQANDQAIKSDIEAKLFQDSVLKQRDIRVEVQNGVVTLTGTVNTELEKSGAGRIAQQEAGVTQVVNNLTVGASSSPLAAPTSSVTIPAGTVVTVRMIDSIDSSRNHPGEEFHASLDSPVVVGDRVVFPKGSEATIRLVNAGQAGTVRGSSSLQLQLVSVTANGKVYPVESADYELHGGSKGKRTAEATGAGAIVGGLIGAIAGGRKGAAIGAGAGAGTGAAASAITKGQVVRVPSETKLDFRLRSAVSVGP
jgi:hypothetical protein